MMKKIPVSELKPGMKFSRAVYITPTNMLVSPNTPLKESDIEKLKKWGIKEVETAGEIIYVPEETPKASTKESSVLKEKIIEEYQKLHRMKNRYLEIYNETVELVKEIIIDLQNKRKVSRIKIKPVISSFVTSVLTNEHIFIYMASNLCDEYDYLPYHSVNVSIFSIIIGHNLKMESANLSLLAESAILHDIGMINVPSQILKKKEKLTPKEYEIIKLHPIYGYKILAKDLEFPPEIANVALQHHEQFDGGGYPRKLKGDQIDLFARIVSIADTYEAMTKKRYHRDKFLSYEAMKNVLSESQNKFDPRLLRIFLSLISIYPIASFVKLNTNAICMVIGAYPDKPLRPILKVIIDEFGDKIYNVEERYIDLVEEPSMYIVSAIDEKEVGIKAFDVI